MSRAVIALVGSSPTRSFVSGMAHRESAGGARDRRLPTRVLRQNRPWVPATGTTQS